MILIVIFLFFPSLFLYRFKMDNEMRITATEDTPEVYLDVKPLMDAVDLHKTWSVLVPGYEAWELSRFLGHSFRIQNAK